ncbi:MULTISPECIES: DUF3568 family protein [Francisella]|uniref:DUF3568 domain-containing protein n=2 Tax=Francisella TaxID=262 RepID=A0AAJ4NP75_9GAMM|nr:MULTISPECIES: DUF3568 family protein [Francisella]QEO57822.1 DUF3568 family protein [Francisella marina]QEO59952.1 DUF3568 family protein [Francisella marina]QWU99246.1 DUF3568 domain-containing protein [Francisella salimarina]
MKLKKILTASLLAASALSLSSCWLVVAGAVGAGTVAYVDGKYSMNLDGSLKDVTNATLKAISENDNLEITKKNIAPTKTDIKGKTKVGSTDFYVEIREITKNASKVTIKFGTFGDQAMSATLMGQIQKDL